jgi:hypothetical protein
MAQATPWEIVPVDLIGPWKVKNPSGNLCTIPRMPIPTLFVGATSQSRKMYDCTVGRHVRLYQGHGLIS